MNSDFHKAQAEAMIKKLNSRDFGYEESIKRDYILTLAHALLANIVDEEPQGGYDR